MNDLSAQINNLFNNIRRLQARTHAEIGIVGAAIIEEKLERALLTKMRPMSGAMRRRLFEGYGPLSSFSAKIDLSYALQLVDKKTWKDLTVVRKVRNQFAHSMSLVNFGSPEIVGHFQNAKGADAKGIDYQAYYLEMLKKIESDLEQATSALELSSETQHSSPNDAP